MIVIDQRVIAIAIMVIAISQSATAGTTTVNRDHRTTHVVRDHRGDTDTTVKLKPVKYHPGKKGFGCGQNCGVIVRDHRH